MIHVHRFRGLVPLAAAVLLSSTGPGLAQSPEDIAYGAVDYARYCAQCHGDGGLGDGPLAEHMIRKPTDLTRLTALNSGLFPDIMTYNLIDNGGDIAEHVSPDRPPWGDLFMAEPSPLSPDTAADTRIYDLIDFIKSIQD